MVRTQGPPTDDPIFRRGRADRNPLADSPLPLDAGLTDADDPDEQQQFRRAARRVPVKRGTLALPRRIAARVKSAVLLVLAIAALGTAAYQVRDFALHSGRFRLRNERDIELAGEAPNSSGPVMEKMREVLGRNIFLISMDERKRELEKVPWVESATVMRLWPNRLRVLVKERTPVAFVAIAGRIQLIDAQGVVMDLSSGVAADYAFPVVRGMTESDPLSTRAARMKTFARLLRELNGEDASAETGPEKQSVGEGKVQYSRNLEEVELSDPGDVKVTVKGPSGPILLHLGNENFLPRFMIYLSNVQKWEHERGKLESVDLRYGRQVILNPDMSASPPAMALAKTAPPSAATTPHFSRPAANRPEAPRFAARPKPAAHSAKNVSKAGAQPQHSSTGRAWGPAKANVPKMNAKKDAAAPRPQRAAPKHWRGTKQSRWQRETKTSSR